MDKSKITKQNGNIAFEEEAHIYYDVTNFFFEIEEPDVGEDDLRKMGVSKEHRKQPIVQMGLFMDGDGLPLSFNIYPGNKNEQTALIPEESKIKNHQFNQWFLLKHCEFQYLFYHQTFITSSL